jgi:hypothetical protein
LLGFSALSGKQAIDQATRFKEQLRSLSPKPQHVSLLTVMHADPPSAEVVAMFDADEAAAVEWVRQAEQVSAEL